MTAAPGPRLRVLGTKAAFVVRELDGQEDVLRSGAGPIRCEIGALSRSRAGVDSCQQASRSRASAVIGPRFYELLLRAIRDGDPPPVDPRDAVAALRVLEAARRSATGREVVELSA